MNLHYDISGAGETIVFIHGAFVNADIWQHQRDFFKDYYQVITVDLRGHGRSDTTEQEEYDVRIFGEDVLHLLNSLGIEKATICGLSLGAMVAQYLGANYPNRVNGLLLVGATASLRLSVLERVVTTLFFPKWFAMWLFSKLSTSQFMRLSFFLTWFMLGNRWLGNRSTRYKIKMAIGQVKRNELKKIYAAVHTFRKQDLGKGSFPVLMLNGEHDSPVIHRHCRYMLKKLAARGEKRTIAHAGHACNHDQPFIFNRITQEWLLSHSITPTMVKSSRPAGKIRTLHQAS
ncbi:MAG: alpha/beta hydrolase [Salibacteraceae bacterium]